MEINFGTSKNNNSYAQDDIILLADLIISVILCGSEKFQTCLQQTRKGVLI